MLKSVIKFKYFKMIKSVFDLRYYKIMLGLNNKINATTVV